jgi:hypothetical protein
MTKSAKERIGILEERDAWVIARLDKLETKLDYCDKKDQERHDSIMKWIDNKFKELPTKYAAKYVEWVITWMVGIILISVLTLLLDNVFTQ